MLTDLLTAEGEAAADAIGEAACFERHDVTDEDAFRSLRGIGKSVRIGPSTHTAADLALPDPASVVELLRWLASGAFESEGP